MVDTAASISVVIMLPILVVMALCLFLFAMQIACHVMQKIGNREQTVVVPRDGSEVSSPC